MNECNDAKGKQTPFQWWHNNTSGKAPTISWDGYKVIVEKYATTLRNKKVQLLTREDAVELVGRYTALAETAWISKLAQTIANLRFNWTNGYDQNRKKRVIVISGGVTARVRRKYGLDKLLYNKDTDAEVFAKKLKNRADKRHHALDAMVLTFIPQWARDPARKDSSGSLPNSAMPMAAKITNKSENCLVIPSLKSCRVISPTNARFSVTELTASVIIKR